MPTLISVRSPGNFNCEVLIVDQRRVGTLQKYECQMCCAHVVSEYKWGFERDVRARQDLHRQMALIYCQLLPAREQMLTVNHARN